MSDLICHLRPRRERAGLSQQALAAQVGVSRQALSAIEAGRQVPSTRLSLLLARALGCAVEDLFTLPRPAALPVRTAVPGATGRAVLGQVRGQWVAHPLPPGVVTMADGILLPDGHLQPLSDLTPSLLVAGCAPLLGLLARHAGHHADVRVGWLPASSGRALAMLDAGLIHVAGLHFFDASDADANRAAIQARFAGQAMTVVNLTCWRQGLLAAPGNPRGLAAVADLLQPGLRFARRGPGAGASKLVRGVLGDATLAGPMAEGHLDVARLIRAGAADAGVAIEAAALAAGLPFLPLSEERFDLVFPAALAGHPGIARLLDVLTSRPFRTEAAHIPGYDLRRSGHTEAA